MIHKWKKIDPSSAVTDHRAPATDEDGDHRLGPESWALWTGSKSVNTVSLMMRFPGCWVTAEGEVPGSWFYLNLCRHVGHPHHASWRSSHVFLPSVSQEPTFLHVQDYKAIFWTCGWKPRGTQTITEGFVMSYQHISFTVTLLWMVFNMYMQLNKRSLECWNLYSCYNYSFGSFSKTVLIFSEL